jgi:hypothetical protein
LVSVLDAFLLDGRRVGTLRWILRPYRAWCGGFGALLDWFLGFGFGFFWVFEVIKKCRNVR